MDKKETAYWNRLRPHFARNIFVRRIENGVADGDPDVFLMKDGEATWLELKWATMPVHETSMLLGKGAVRLGQINWHLEYAHKGGRSYVLIGTKTSHFLMPGYMANRLNDMTVCECYACATIWSNESSKKLVYELEKKIFPWN